MDSSTMTLNRSDNDPAFQGFFSPRRSAFRFIGLAFMCLLGFASYFCYDNPAALQDQFKADLHMSTSKFVLLYSVYSWPNVVLCFIGGFLLDRLFGIRWGTIIYMTLTLIGQIIFATGAYMNIFWMMLLGRFIFGIGAESLAVAQNSYAVLWFKGKELNMVFGLQLSFARLGSTVNFLVMEEVYGYVSKILGYKGSACIGLVLFFSALTCIGSMICALLLGLMDSHAEKELKRNEGQEEPQLVKFTDAKDFRPIFWLIAWICVAYYIAIFPFISLGKVYFIRKYAYDPATANKVTSLVYSVSAIAAPAFGILVDKTGRNVFWVILSIIGSLIAHGMLTFTYINPYFCMIFLGLSYSLLAGALWPLIALVIPEHQLGTAYGTAQALQNLGLAVTSMGCGLIVDRYGYFMLELFFLAWLWISLITAVVIWICDSNHDGYLNMTINEREYFNRNPGLPERSEREKLLSGGGGSISDLSSDDPLQPQSDSQMRNRYLARIGAESPVHVTDTT